MAFYPDIVTRGSGIYRLLDAVTADGESERTAIPKGAKSAQVSITGDGAVSATAALYGTNDVELDGLLLFTFPLSGTTTDHSEAPNPGEEIPEYPIYYYKALNITGTNAAVTATLAV